MERSPHPQSQAVSDVVEHLFRRESAKMVATLTRIFGIDHLTLAEDVVQEALARALKTWSFYGVPDNPSAWIMRTARNLALDVVRREKRFRDKEPEIARIVEDEGASNSIGQTLDEHGIADDRLRMMFVCCHPAIPPEAQVALSLKTLCGFSAQEIASAFLTTEAAIAKRLTRARQRIRETGIPFEIPAGEELTQRLDGVLQCLYLLFNEGYKASSGERLVREDVCDEAIRLTALLAEHPAGNVLRTHALLALMHFNAARIPARIDAGGNLIRLQDQDRSLWNRAVIMRGIHHLTRSVGAATGYHVEAGIAACHSLARDYASTDWAQILTMYDRLIQIDPSPVVALNRAVAVAELHGPARGIEAIQEIPALATLESYHLLHAVLGELESRRGNFSAAAGHIQRALDLVEIGSERDLLARRLQECERRAGSPALAYAE